ncbi:ankyrin [Tuber magnatum]|uniref:Ankyrin n=1 Tax=Tuber magnatum TaxID=42249 RepID=A0A317SS19_9PEZI|nr:ankyrin [Tuber magnatum]
MSLSSIPSEVLLMIAERLSPPDMSHLVRTSRYFRCAYLGFARLLALMELILCYMMHGDSEVDLVDRKGRTALHLAALYGARQLSKRFLEHPDIALSISDGYGDTPLHVAVGRQCKRTTHALLEAGADAVHHDGDGATPLLRAIMDQSAEMVKLLLAYPPVCVNTPWASPGRPGMAGMAGIPPLHTAIALADDKLVNMLLAHPGLDINMRTRASVILQLANEDLVLPEYCSAIRLASTVQQGAPLPVISIVYTAHTHFHPLDLRSRDPLQPVPAPYENISPGTCTFHNITDLAPP